jgi:hypothetical protein
VAPSVGVAALYQTRRVRGRLRAAVGDALGVAKLYCGGDEQAGKAYLLSRSRSELSRDAIKAEHRGEVSRRKSGDDGVSVCYRAAGNERIGLFGC